MPRIRRLASPGRFSRRVPVDEAEQVDSVLGVLTELVGHELADVAGPDDDRVLEIGDRATAERASESTGARHEHDSREPERDLTLERRIGKPGRLGGDEEHPGPHRHEMENAEQVIGGRVVGSLLVGVVEPVEASSDEPQRHGREEDQDLRRVAHGVRLPVAGEA